MQLLALSGEAAGLSRFEAPVVHRSLAVGTYDLLVFNQGDNFVRGLERLSTAEIVAPVSEAGGKRYTANCQQAVYADLRRDMPVHTDDTTHCTFVPRPLVRQITLHLLVKGMEALPGIERLSGELDGVATSRFLASGTMGSGHATLVFPFLPTAGHGRFTGDFLVLGIKDEVENVLRLKACFEGGGEGETSVSLDDALDSFVADRIVITVEVDVSPSLALTAVITEWTDEEWGGIVIQ
jgi:hypothetical protein